MSAAAQLLISCVGLLVLAVLPLLLVWLLATFTQAPSAPGSIVIGNSALLTEEKPDEPPLLTPLVHLVRTAEEPMLRNLMLGLRFLPVEQTEPILKRYRATNDAELQIYSQSVRQEAMQSLQATYLQLKAQLGHGRPELVASYLTAGLRLLDAPFTPETEHTVLRGELEKAASAALERQETLPRLLFEAGRVLTRCDRLNDAESAFHRLPEASPLRDQAHQLLTYRRAIAQVSGGASPPLGGLDQMHSQTPAVL